MSNPTALEFLIAMALGGLLGLLILFAGMWWWDAQLRYMVSRASRWFARGR